MIKWLFFDLGSTLIDESDCLELRVQETLKQPNAPDRLTFEKRMIELAKQNILGDIIGSRFEFDNGGWTKDMRLSSDTCQRTSPLQQ